MLIISGPELAQVALRVALHAPPDAVVAGAGLNHDLVAVSAVPGPLPVVTACLRRSAGRSLLQLLSRLLQPQQFPVLLPLLPVNFLEGVEVDISAASLPDCAGILDAVVYFLLGLVLQVFEGLHYTLSGLLGSVRA